MKTLRELERELETLEDETTKGTLRMTLDDGRNIKINLGDQDGILRFLGSAIKNEDHPYKKYVMRAVEGHPEEGQFVMLCKAIWEAHSRIAAEKAGV